MEFYDDVGPMALGSRLRRLSDRLYESAKRTYALYQIPMDPKWFPVFYVLSQRKEASTQTIADYVGHSHASISQIVKAMANDGFVSSTRSQQDGRKNVLKLTKKARTVLSKIKPQYEDVSSVVNELLQQTPHDLWRSIADLERALDEASLFERVQRRHKLRQQQQVEIVEYSDRYAREFRDLNVEWIKRYFEVEQADLNYLEHPRKNILDPGGQIFIALLENRVVGTCALIRMDEHTYELAKMGVRPQAQGRRVGWLLGEACANWARQQGAKKLYLESSTKLTPAISLYRKMGFVEVAERPSPYSRADIYMELSL